MGPVSPVEVVVLCCLLDGEEDVVIDLRGPLVPPGVESCFELRKHRLPARIDVPPVDGGVALLVDFVAGPDGDALLAADEFERVGADPQGLGGDLHRDVVEA